MTVPAHFASRFIEKGKVECPSQTLRNVMNTDASLYSSAVANRVIVATAHVYQVVFTRISKEERQPDAIQACLLGCERVDMGRVR